MCMQIFNCAISQTEHELTYTIQYTVYSHAEGRAQRSARERDDLKSVIHILYESMDNKIICSLFNKRQRQTCLMP